MAVILVVTCKSANVVQGCTFVSQICQKKEAYITSLRSLNDHKRLDGWFTNE